MKKNSVPYRLPKTPLLNRRLIINIGKGGVGRSIVSAAMALEAARQNQRTLLIQCNAKDRISEYLNTRSVTEDIQEILPNLFCVNIKPEAAIKEYVLLQVKLEVIYKVVFKNRVVNAFLNAVPALSDLVTIGKTEYHVRERLPSGKPKYDVVIVDAAPTGHGIFLLSVPKVMAEAAKVGPIVEHSMRMHRFLQNQEQCAVNLVTLPEEMPVSETVDTYRILTNTLGITPLMVIINRYHHLLFEPQDLKTVNHLLSQQVKANPANVALQVFKTEIQRAQKRREHLDHLAESLELPMITLPDLTSLRFNRDEVEEIAEYLREVL